MKDALSPDQGRARNIFRVDGDHRTQSYDFSFVASEINAFDLMTGAFEGSIPINVGAGNTPGRLWGLMFGSGAGNGGDANTLYFNDEINGETGGLFGALMVPAPATRLLLGTGSSRRPGDARAGSSARRLCILHGRPGHPRRPPSVRSGMNVEAGSLPFPVIA